LTPLLNPIKSSRLSEKKRKSFSRLSRWWYRARDEIGGHW
jgi:hypothetical protein